MPTDEEILELEKKLNSATSALQKREEDLLEKELIFTRSKFISLGGSEKKANQYEDVKILNALIDDLEERKNEEAKKKEEEDKEEDKDKKDKKENEKVVINAGIDTVRFPDGSIQKANPRRVKFNQGSEVMHFLDPMKVPRYLLKFSERARINTLPPDEEHPYYRVIA